MKMQILPIMAIEGKKVKSSLARFNIELRLLKKAIERVREQEKEGRLDPDLNLTMMDMDDVFLPIGH